MHITHGKTDSPNKKIISSILMYINAGGAGCKVTFWESKYHEFKINPMVFKVASYNLECGFMILQLTCRMIFVAMVAILSGISEFSSCQHTYLDKLIQCALLATHKLFIYSLLGKGRTVACGT